VLEDGSVLALNKDLLLRSSNKGVSWSKLISINPGGEISGGRLLHDPKGSSLSLIGVAQKTAVPGHAGQMVRVVSTDSGHSFSKMEQVGNISTEMWGPVKDNVTLNGFDNILAL